MLTFRKSLPADRDAVLALLGRVMGAASLETLGAPGFPEWKYWDAHPHWPGGRSYVLAEGEAIHAHVCGWPIRLAAGGAPETATLAIDWATERGAPAGGLTLMKRLSQEAARTIAIGGSEAAQRVLPAFGFKPVNQMLFLSRPLRPLRKRLARDWRLPLRRLRDVAQSLVPRVSTRGWSAEAVAPDQVPDELWPRARPDWAVSLRDARLYDYVLRCPIARMKLFLVRSGSWPIGYFCLAFVPGKARIVDYWLLPSVGVTLAPLFSLCCAEALSEPDVQEIVAGVTEPEAVGALRQSGFRRTGHAPIRVLIPSRERPAPPFYRVTMLDSDAAFIHGLS